MMDMIVLVALTHGRTVLCQSVPSTTEMVTVMLNVIPWSVCMMEAIASPHLWKGFVICVVEEWRMASVSGIVSHLNVPMTIRTATVC